MYFYNCNHPLSQRCLPDYFMKFTYTLSQPTRTQKQFTHTQKCIS